MEFGDWTLTHHLDDCPVRSLSEGIFWSFPDSGSDRVPVASSDGTTWQVSAVLSAAGDLHTIAEAPDGKPFYIGNSNKVDVEVEITGGSAVFTTTFVNAVFDGPDELAATITITCDA